MIIPETVEILKNRYAGRLEGLAVEKVSVGLFYSGVKLSNGDAGVSYTPAADIQETIVCCPKMAAKKQAEKPFKGMPVLELLEMEENSLLTRTVKVAALNALSRESVSNGAYNLVMDRDVLELMPMADAKRVCMVGAFVPFLKKLKEMRKVDLSVVEFRKNALREDEQKYYVSPENSAQAMNAADILIITGSSIANGSIDGLLDYVRPQTVSAVVGPTSSFIPDALFKRNIRMVSGVVVTDSDKALDIISEGGGAYHLFQSAVSKVTMLNQ